MVTKPVLKLLTRPCPKQESTLKSWLGNSEGARVFDKRAQFFFSRGHLAPDADFIYKGPFTYDVLGLLDTLPSFCIC